MLINYVVTFWDSSLSSLELDLEYMVDKIILKNDTNILLKQFVLKIACFFK